MTLLELEFEDACEAGADVSGDVTGAFVEVGVPADGELIVVVVVW